MTAVRYDTEPATGCQLTTPILIDTDPGIDDPPPAPLAPAPHAPGHDALGNVGRCLEPDGRLRYPEPSRTLEMLDGAGFILETADHFAGRLVIVALGPLTNVALALQRDPARLAQAARLVVMGGAVAVAGDRKSTRLNSSHGYTSYGVF